jgi:hypothetical protein
MSTGDTDPASNDAGLGESGGQVKPLTPEHKPLTPEQEKVQLEWLKEQGADLRARTQAEYLYTAAALAFYGGVCWGVGAVPKSGLPVAIGILIVAVLISGKIAADHRTYSRIWRARGILIEHFEPTNKEGRYILFPEPEDSRSWPWLDWGNRQLEWADRLIAPSLPSNTPTGLRGEPRPPSLPSDTPSEVNRDPVIFGQF